jgi:RNA polymerase sigma factor (sigma-70 family)
MTYHHLKAIEFGHVDEAIPFLREYYETSDFQLRQLLIEKLTPHLHRFIVSRYRGKVETETLSDIKMYCTTLLIKVIDEKLYRLDAGKAFSTYLMASTIRRVGKYFRDHGDLIRTAAHQKEKMWLYNVAIGKFKAIYGRNPNSAQEIALFLGKPANHFDEILRLAPLEIVSLDTPLNSNSTETHGDLLASDRQDPFYLREETIDIESALEKLTLEERGILIECELTKLSRVAARRGISAWTLFKKRRDAIATIRKELGIAAAS